MYQCGKGKPAFDAKLPVDAMQVKFDSSFADTQLVRNRFVAKTLGGETHDLAFAHESRSPSSRSRAFGQHCALHAASFS